MALFENNNLPGNLDKSRIFDIYIYTFEKTAHINFIALKFIALKHRTIYRECKENEKKMLGMSGPKSN